MKKLFRTITIAALAVMMVISCTPAFAAAEFSGVDVTTKGPAPTAAEKQKPGAEKEAQAAPVKTVQSAVPQAGATFTAVTMNTNKSKKADGKVLAVSGTDVYNCWSISTKAAGKLYVDVAAHSDNDASVQVVVGKFNSGTGQITYSGSPRYISAGSTVQGIGGDYYGVDVKAGQTWWIGVKTSSSSGAVVAATAYVVPYGIRNLKAGQVLLTSGKKGDGKDSAALFRIKPTKSGYITVTLNEGGMDKSAGYVTLLNKNKRAVSDKLWYYQGSKYSYVVFGVRKGTTYYLRVNDCYGTSEYRYAYAIKYTTKLATLRTNVTKRKAVNLKRKAKFISTAMPATGKKSNQWYKFRVPKKQKTVIVIDATKVKSGKNATITFYAGSSKIASSTISNGSTNTFTLTHSTTYGQANPGLYYFKITKPAKTNGAYRIRYKQ